MEDLVTQNRFKEALEVSHKTGQDVRFVYKQWALCALTNGSVNQARLHMSKVLEQVSMYAIHANVMYAKCSKLFEKNFSETLRQKRGCGASRGGVD